MNNCYVTYYFQCRKYRNQQSKCDYYEGSGKSGDCKYFESNILRGGSLNEPPGFCSLINWDHDKDSAHVNKIVVLRGSWRYDQYNCRPDFRGCYYPTFSDGGIGFRVIRRRFANEDRP